jgi:pimeloyl-ACP methyl ester carboxylesterase
MSEGRRHLRGRDGYNSRMNDYVARMLDLLGEDDPILVLESMPVQLEAHLLQLGPDVERPYAPGKWNARQLMAHLADNELAAGFRLRQVVAGVETVQPYDQNSWATRYARTDPALALETFQALRAWNLALYAGFGLEDWLREVQHPERGMLSVDIMVRMLAGHDLNHLAQLESLV